MVQECYDWVWKLAGYLIFMTAVLQLVPGEKDRKYIHFFTGLVLIILIASPVIKFFTSDDLFVQFQDQYDAMETQVEEMLKNTSGLESVMKSQDNRNAEDELSENVEGGEPGGIQVEEIRIGHGSEIRKVFEHLKHGKVKKDQLLIVFLVGILLLVISIPAGTKKDSNTGTKKTLANSSKSSVGTTKQSEYTAYMEERLERILSQIDGAGQVQVMITWKSDGEKVVEKDRKSNEENVSEQDSQGGSRTTSSHDIQETTVYNSGSSTSGVQEPYVSKELSPQAQGVIVIAPGGDDAVVVKNITEAVQALFEIDTHKIRIMKGGRVK